MDPMGERWIRSVPVAVGLLLTCFVAASMLVEAAAVRGAATGEEVYAAQKCASCHSVGGAGNQKYPLDGVGARLSEADIRDWLVNPDAQQAKKGTRPLMRMPSYKALPPEDVDALVGYLKTLK
jgi:mono/diheme cytochrome c family protein